MIPEMECLSMIPETQVQPTRDELMREVRAAAFGAAVPYVDDGVVLYPAVKNACDLIPSVQARGLRGLLADMTVDEVVACLEHDKLPVPARDNREGYGDSDHAFYWLFGLDDYRKLIGAVDERGVDHGRSLDIGCATGRICRNLLVQSDFREVHGCDFKRMHVTWCKTYLPAEFRVFLNTTLPHLPYPDGHFDVVTAFSVLTHIDALEDAWLLELARIVRPGGLLYLTVQDETSWAHMPKLLEDRLRTTPEGLTTDFEARPMPAEHLVFSDARLSHYGCTVFHSTGYIRRFWGNYFEIEEILPLRHNHQSVVIGRRGGR